MKITHIQVLDTYQGDELKYITANVVLDGVMEVRVEVSVQGPVPVFTFPVGVSFSHEVVEEKIKEQITKHVATYRAAQLLEEV